ncbi:MAG: hypothetical protein NXI23_04750 [Bacteroidetes bacterium]|jgi:cytochrome oxidase Cu insertion factor (SCO1/SenC/PrrC family)|nr:hypothetical protein [Bacteroidota bacterium]MDF1867817.1 hypothetical protein [Saprospiraceae bacterium]
MNKLHPLKVIGIMLVLFGLPLGSWFFMKSGADFRMASINEMGKYGEIQDFDLELSNGKRLTKEDVAKKVLMVNFLSADDLDNNEVFDRLKWIQEQFQERLLKRTDFMFLSHIKFDSISDLNKYQIEIDKDEGKNYRRWNLLSGEAEVLSNLAKNSYHLPLKEGESTFDNPYLAIVDTDMQVRYFYNIFEKDDVAKLMMHLSILLPPQDDRKVEIKTEIKN